MAGFVPWARVVISWPDGTRTEVMLFGEDAPDLAAVEVLARFQLVLRRFGGGIRLEAVSASLDGLLELAGLRREVSGQLESREELLGVEERVNPRDTVA